MIVSRLKEVLGPGGWLEEDADTLKYRTDWRGGVVGKALLVARPDATQQVAAVVAIAREAKVAIVPQGGNTGLVLGSIPTEERPTIVLSTERMNAVRNLDPDNFTMVAEAGCVVQALQERAADADRLFPLSLASEGSCTLGGTLATNAGGNQTIRFGNAREQVLGLEVVMPDATVLDGLNTLRKNNTGYDLKQLFIGAEGTLGIITAAAMRLMPYPKRRDTVFVAVPNPQAAAALLRMSRELSGDAVLAFELMPRYSLELAMEHIEGVSDPLSQPSPWYVLMEMATSSEIDNLREKLERIIADAMEDGWVTDGVIAESEEQRLQLWRAREEQAEAGRRAGPAVNCDISVPVSRVPEFLDVAKAALEAMLPRVELNTFGHMGDGNIHYTIRKPQAMATDAWQAQTTALSDRINEIVADFNGSFSAEHGVGARHRAKLTAYASPQRLALMRTIKQAIDSEGLMNPGKIL